MSSQCITECNLQNIESRNRIKQSEYCAVFHLGQEFCRVYLIITNTAFDKLSEQ